MLKRAIIEFSVTLYPALVELIITGKIKVVRYHLGN